MRKVFLDNPCQTTLNTKVTSVNGNIVLFEEPKSKEKMNQNDTSTTLQQLKIICQKFIDDRNWHEPTNPKNLTMQLSIEANELMQKFLWITTEQSRSETDRNREAIEDETADVFFTLLHFCNAANIDISQAFHRKLLKIEKKISC